MPAPPIAPPVPIPILPDPIFDPPVRDVGRCCCGGGPVAGPCCTCSSIPIRYTVPVAGVTDGICTDCELWNATHTIILGSYPPVPAECEWQKHTIGQVCAESDNANIVMHCRAEPDPNKMSLVFQTRNESGRAHLTLAIYRKPLASWSCLGVNTLNLEDINPYCENWPATVTVTPA